MWREFLEDVSLLCSYDDHAEAQLEGWQELVLGEIGDYNLTYSYRYHCPSDEGDGAIAVFSHGEFLTFLMVRSTGGQATADLRRYGGIVDARIRVALASLTPGP